MKIVTKISLLLLLYCGLGFGQKSMIYINELVEFNHAVELYEEKDYAAAQILFKKIRDDFDDDSELKARSYYFEAFCAIRLGQTNGEDLMNDFFEQFPTSTKRNSAFLEVGDYYFNNRRYAYALKWFSKVNGNNLTLYGKEEFSFKKGYALFAVGRYGDSKRYFSELLDSERYGAQAKYYYGYMAYQDDNYVEADKYLNEVAEGEGFDEEIDYYLVNIRFKTGKFQEAIDTGIPLLEESNGLQRSELSKIIGESYFNLNQYEEAIPYLEDYEGKKGKWNNSDFYLLGYAFYKQGLYEDAIIWFSKIIDGNNAVSQNAYYHLAECYLKSDKKQEALNAFRNAKEMDFDNTIKRDAWVNYAKLGYEIGNPYKSPAQVIQEYLKAFPESEDSEAMKNLLVSAYLGTEDFEGALAYLQDSEDEQGEIYQKVSFLYGAQLFKRGDFRAASQQFDNAISSGEEGQSPVIRARAYFWKAESKYRLENYPSALDHFKKFAELDGSQRVEEQSYYLYHIAYTYFQMGDYNQAGGHFNEYISTSSGNGLLTDSYLRLGDSYFALSNYYKAIEPYERVIEANDKGVDYAQIQIALCQGFLGNNDKKIETLMNFTELNLKSPLRPNAYYELGNTYVKLNDSEKALEAYQMVIQNHRRSALVPKSLLKQGLVYYNSDRNEDALNKYKIVIDRYPGTDESIEAVANAKQIYIDMGRIDEYENYVKGIDFVNVSDQEIENALYTSAEQFYLSNDLEKAIESLKKYLDRFPSGMHSTHANFYLAEAYRRSGDLEKAQPYYQHLAGLESNAYTERSLVQTSRFELENGNWEKAITSLKRLEESAGSYESLIFAQSNLMKGYYALKDYTLAVDYADKVLQQDKIEDKVRADAQVIIARAAFETGEMIKAQDAFALVGESATGDLKAETLYYDAFFKHEEGNYKLSNVSIQEIASSHPDSRYWGAKGLVVMAKNFYAMEDAYQATYILESVIEKFASFDDVVEEARVELNKIKQEEAKTNSSVILENN